MATTQPDESSGITPFEKHRGRMLVTSGGLVLVGFALIAFAAAAFRLFGDAERIRGWEGYIPELLLCGIAMFGAVLGVSLLRIGGLVGTEPNRVINEHEWQEIQKSVCHGDEGAVNLYVRLTGLTGITGFFTKLGLTGLPLATIGLTIFFSVMFFNSPEFMDLAKLTLGAFIGSFVQRQATPQQAGGNIRLPGGEIVRFNAPPPS